MAVNPLACSPDRWQDDVQSEITSKPEKGGIMTEKTFRVEGMSCGHCRAAVERELNGVSGVERSSADFERGTVEVAYDEDRVTTEDIRSAVEEAGYTLAV